MAQQDIVSGLFGLSPFQVQQQQQAAIDTRAADFARMNAAQRGTMGMFQAGAGLGGLGAQAAGMVNPEVEAARQREAMLGQIDMTTPQGILQGAEMARQRGDVRMQMQLQMLAQQKQAEASKMAYEAAKTRREEVMAEEEPIRRHEEKMAAIEQRAEAARMRSEDARLSTGMRAEAARERNDLMRVIAEQKTGAKSEKEEAAARLKAMNFSNRADTIIGKVDEALQDVGFFSTGLTGATLGVVPGTKAYRLRKTADTIKANIGFQELQNMRDASVTGGALGQVAVKELDMLQATISNLDPNQDPDTLSRNLNQVKDQYSRAKSAYNNAIKESESGVAQQPKAVSQGAKRWNPQTGRWE